MREFVRAAQRVIESLPEPFRVWLDNVLVDVELSPSPKMLADLGMAPDETLFGLFIGAPIGEREGGEIPFNRILLFKRPIEESCDSTAEIEYEIRRTLLHELAHHFGFEENDLDAFEAKPSPFQRPPATSDGAHPDDHQPST